MLETSELLGFSKFVYLARIEEKEDLMEEFMEIDTLVNDFKWRLAKAWMFGDSEYEMSDEDQLAVAGLI